MSDPDILACILAVLPLAHWEKVSTLSKAWASAVLAIKSMPLHANLIGWHPGLSSEKFTWPTCVAERPHGAGLVVSEAWSHQLRLFDVCGRESGTIGAAGRAPGQFI